jgi:methylated-DNA-protein-cysteine methyltransferase-like protein
VTSRPSSSSSPDSRTFRDRVYQIVRSIPYGRVTTYGTIAVGAGKPGGAREVGWLVHNPPEDVAKNCHRVVNASGYLSGGWSFGHPEIMASLLKSENVPFKGEYRVDLKAAFWEPESDLTATHEMDDFEDIAGPE